jgi:putative copper resistance protein D
VRQIRWILSFSALLALLSGISWFIFTAGTMAGGLSQAFQPDSLKAMVQATDFGPLWIARFVLLVIAAALLLRWPLRPAHWALPIAASLLLASLAGTGHARATEGWDGYLHQASDAAHLIVAGVWLGGLWPLGLMIAASSSRISQDGLAIGDVLTRFSGVGTIAVAVLVASGAVNSWFLVGTPAALFSTTYGWLLSVKVALFVFMALLASANRFWLTPKLIDFPTSGAWLARLRLHVFGEQALGLIVVGLVSLLGTLEPAIAQ